MVYGEYETESEVLGGPNKSMKSDHVDQSNAFVKNVGLDKADEADTVERVKEEPDAEAVTSAACVGVLAMVHGDAGTPEPCFVYPVAQ